MRTVIANSPDNPNVLASEASPSKYYGFVSNCDRVGFVYQQYYQNGEFRTLCPNSVTMGNKWDFANHVLPVLIKELVNTGFKVFEFDTPRELFNWLTMHTKP